ncbi:TerD family protein [Nitrococcus mobilis]|uniref:Tellurium resistance protein TerA n=1 Tax=Nitrococcus mobilis Nb-231 TaxID=314278 RepID=A4BT10_9GAMM|nr:TerD family protein [Nitrococcus mobilis]EAR21078.1 tellurium resistance protein TerA [Nitrococcus mobilis Nb-231]
MNLQPGQNTALSELSVCAELSWTPAATALELDPSAFLLTSTGKVAGDEGFVFYGQPKSADGAVVLDAARREFLLELKRLSAGIEKVVIALTIDQGQKRGQRFGDLSEVKLTVTGAGEPLVFPLAASGMSEVALIIGEFYKRNGQWKFRAVGQGFNGGLGPLATHYGVEVKDDPEQAEPSTSPPSHSATPTPSTTASSAPVNLNKITLEKKKPVSLTKESGQYGRIIVNLNWTKGKGGGGFFSRNKGIDLDLGCFVELQSGAKDVVQALGNTFGAYDSKPYAHLLADDRTGEASQGEFLHINGDQWSQLRRVLVYAFIYEGAPNWAAADAVITIKAPDQPELVVRLDSHSSSEGMCAVAMLENDGGKIKVSKLIDYYRGHRFMDEAYGWGFSWRAGRK